MDGIVDENLCLDFRGKGTKCALLLLNIATMKLYESVLHNGCAGCEYVQKPSGYGCHEKPQRGVPGVVHIKMYDHKSVVRF